MQPIMTTSISTQDTGKAVAKRAPLTQDELETMIRAVAAADADVAGPSTKSVFPQHGRAHKGPKALFAL